MTPGVLFDRTHIAIRERNFLEILDLALQLVRERWPGLLAVLVLGAVPAAVLNYALLGGLLDTDEVWQDPWSYGLWMLLLMAFETPLVTAPLTLYLGQATFSGSASPRQIVWNFLGSLGQLVWFQVLLRGLLTLLFGFGLIIPYVSWPYLTEIILLERNPFLMGDRGSITTWRRNRNFHRYNGGDLFVRWLAALGSGAVLGASVVWGLHSVASHLVGAWPDELTVLRWYVPIAGWLVLGFFAVVRFLAYLDLRIRREGWEVELTMRAEALRLVQGVAR